MAETRSKRRSRRALSMCVVLLVLGLSPAAPAFAQAARQAEDRLVTQLVLNSAIIRQAVEKRAAQERFALFQRLAERDSQLTAALADARLERSRRVRLEKELEAVRAERQAFIAARRTSPA